jgi:thymidylate synthase complementing protein thyX
MKIIKPSVSYISQSAGLTGVYKQIELAGRTAYKSEDKITEDSAEKFVKMLMTRKHNAVLEHGTVYLKYRCKWEGDSLTNFYEKNPYSDVVYKLNEDDYENGWAMATFYITTNYRVIVENDRSRDLRYMSPPYESYVKRHTIKFILSRGIANEFVRHRVFSFLQESTRYCNYSKDKFGGVTFIPSVECPLEVGEYVLNDDVDIIKDGDIYIHNKEIEELSQKELMFYAYCVSEQLYLSLLDKGMKPQIARDVLPLGLKTELIMTGTTEQWKEFCNLRCAPDAHPDARYLADKVKELINF